MTMMITRIPLILAAFGLAGAASAQDDPLAEVPAAAVAEDDPLALPDETADEPARPGAPRSGPGESRRRETLSEARGDARRAAVWSDEARVGPARGEGREGPVRGEGREGPVRGEGREGPVRGEGREGPVHGEGRQGPTRTGASRDEDRSGRAAGSDRGRERSLGSHDGPPGRPRDELRDARQAGRAGRDADATDPGDPQAARDGDETTSRSRSSTSTPRAAFDLPRPDATESIVRRPRVEGERLTGAEVLERLWQLHARRVHGRQLPVGLVLNRSKPWTHTSQQAMQMLAEWPYPVVTQLRDTQAYVVLVGLGRSLFDYHSAQVREHQADWEPLFQWLEQA